MPTTTNANLPYPSLTDAPNGPLQMQALANALDTKVSSGAAWLSFTPSWGAATVSPALGNGTLIGRYTKQGRDVTFQIILTIGSTTNAGSGDFGFANLPAVAVAREQRVMCTAFAANSRAWNGYGVILGSTSFVAPYLPVSESVIYHAVAKSATGNPAVAGTGVPLRSGQFSFLSGENLFIHGTYESAS